MAQQKGDGKGQAVTLRMDWGPHGLSIRVGSSQPVVIPFAESVRIALEAQAWLMSQIAGFLMKSRHPLL